MTSSRHALRESSRSVFGFLLEWVLSPDRIQSFSNDGMQSTRSSVTCGVPQGSVLGPVLFLIYCVDVIAVARRRGFQVHWYTQLYFHAHPTAVDNEVQQLVACIWEIIQWICANRLKVNEDKTQFIWLGTLYQLSKIRCQSVTFWAVSIPPNQCVWECCSIVRWPEHLMSDAVFISPTTDKDCALITYRSCAHGSCLRYYSHVDYCTVWVRFMFSLYGMYSAPRHWSYCASGSSTTSPLTFGINCSGCPFISECSMTCVCAGLWDAAVHQPTSTRWSHQCLLRCLWSDPVEHTSATVHDPSLTLTQFCSLLNTTLFCRVYETLP